MSLKDLIQKISLERHILPNINHLEEYPQPDNNDWLSPEYLLFHKTRRQSLFVKLWNKLFLRFSLKRQPLQLEYFSELLELLANEREALGYTNDSIIKMTTSDKSRFIIWGDVHGALHSFVRTLVELKSRSIIDDNLKIINDDYYFVFLGDVTDRSPYTVKTLQLILHLMAVNEQRVIYLRGNHEDKNMWQEYGLGRELAIRARHLSSEKIPFTTSINRFFKTLPYALYLKVNENNKCKLVRLSHTQIVDNLYNEQAASDFIFGSEDGLSKKLICELEDKKPEKAVLLEGIVCSESSDTTFRCTQGLKLLPSEKGAVVWSPFSSPIKNFQELFGFYNDAVCILDATRNVDKWVISLVKQDVRKLDGFSQKDFNFIIGSEIIAKDAHRLSIAADVEFTGELVIGCTLDLSKISKVNGQGLKNGIELRVNQENAVGGIKGKRLKVVVLDDGYTGIGAFHNATTLVGQYNIDMFLSPLGAPVNTALIPFIKENKINVYFPCTGLDALRDETLKGIVHYRVSYKHEYHALLDYAIEVLKLNRFALVYQEDPWGLGALEGAKESFANHGITEWLEAGYSGNTLDLVPAVNKTIEFNPQAIVFIATYAPAVSFVEKIGVPYLFNKKLMGFAWLTNAFRSFLQKKGIDFIITRVIPEISESSSVEIVKEFIEQQNKYPERKDISWDSLEGYINTSLFIEALKNVQEPITKEKVTNYFENLHGTNFKGLDLDFESQERRFSNDVLVDTGKEMWAWSIKKK